MHHKAEYKDNKMDRTSSATGHSCGQVLLSYFSNGDVNSDEITAGDRFIQQSSVSQRILNREFSGKELLDMLCAITTTLRQGSHLDCLWDV